MPLDASSWESLASSLGLKITSPKKVFGIVESYESYPKIYGLLNGYPIAIERTGREPFHFITIKYASRMPEDMLKKSLKENKELRKEKIEFIGNMLILKKSPVFVGSHLKATANLLEPLISFLDSNNLKLENLTCELCHKEEVKEVILSEESIPALYCTKCIAELERKREEAQREYEMLPVNYFKAFILGSLGAILGGVAWAGLTVISPNIRIGQIYILAAIGISFLVSFGISKAGGKIDKTLQIMGVILTIIGVFLGELISLHIQARSLVPGEAILFFILAVLIGCVANYLQSKG